MYHKIKKIVPLLIIGGLVNIASAQIRVKVGEDTFTIDKTAALEVASSDKGFLPPRMSKTQRDNIKKPVAVGLVVWCNDCNAMANPVPGELCVYLGETTGWVSLTIFTSSSQLTTTRKDDAVTANRPTRISATSAKISGVLTKVTGTLPTETGVVYREITGNDFATLPVLDDSGNAVAPTYKAATDPVVTKAADPIAVTISPLTSTTGSARPYYFRTYAKSPLGIDYGNTVIFNVAAPKFSIPIVSNGNTLNPTFMGKLTVNAGTPQGTITEYGYYSGTANPPTTNKVILSETPAGVEDLETLNEQLNSETFTANPTVPLSVTDYDVKSLGKTYFRYYVVANEETAYSNVVDFSPVADPITGGTAIATVTKADNMVTTAPLQAGKAGSGFFKVHFNVTKAGTYADFTNTISGAATGLSMAAVPGGNFTVGNGDEQTLTFTVSGTPDTSLDGNSFAISRILTPLSTGTIMADPVTGGTAVAVVTAIDPISKPVMASENANSSFTVHFNVSKAGTHADFTPEAPTGATTNLSMNTIPAGNFLAGDDKKITFTISGFPKSSLEGNSFAVPRTGTAGGKGTLSTGTILLDTTTITGNISGGNAYCDTSHSTEVVPVFSPKTGRVWMDRNLGASRKATAIDDFEAYGCLYQWGRGNDGHASITWTTSTTGTPVNDITTTPFTTDSTLGNPLFVAPLNSLSSLSAVRDWRYPQNNSLWQGLNGINNPCPAAYRLPAKNEFDDEIRAFSMTNKETAYASDLKFVATGWRYCCNSEDGTSGELNFKGNMFYWDSTVILTNEHSSLSGRLYATGSGSTGTIATNGANYRNFGMSVRCIKD